MTKTRLIAKITLGFLLAAQLAGLSFLFPPKLESINLTSVSDTLSNNRLSFRGELEGAHSTTSGLVILDQTPENALNTSTGSGTLVINQNVQVGKAGSTATVTTVKSIESETRIFLSTSLANALSDADTIISTVSAIHTVKFTPVSAIGNGAFRVLIPASTTKSTTGDGLPDLDGFDLDGAALPTVACSGGGSNITFSGSYNSATVSAQQIGGTGAWYHSFECRYNGSGSNPTQVTMTIGTAAGNKVINPAPSGYTASHGPGNADDYSFRVQQTEGVGGSYGVVDSTIGTIGVVEAVRVTATVSPTLTFTMTGVASSTSVCGVSTSATSTPISVPFGSLSVNALTNHVAQLLTVSTNAAGGYTVTASESAALTAFNVTGSPTISDTTCGGSCTVATAAEWNTASQTGFGYALQDVSGDAVATALEYNNGATFKSRPFGITAQSIMSDTAAAAADQAYVCYRTIISGAQQAGDYENYVIYIATATF